MIRVLGDRVLVALPPEPEEVISDDGIVLPRDPDRFWTPTQGIVVGLGEKTATISVADALALLGDEERNAITRIHDLKAGLEALAPAAFDVQLGDCVLFSHKVGEQFTAGDIDYVLLFESDIICVVEPFEKEKVA